MPEKRLIFTHLFYSLTTVVVNHNFGVLPYLIVPFDTTAHKIDPADIVSITHATENQTTITFSGPKSGSIRLESFTTSLLSLDGTEHILTVTDSGQFSSNSIETTYIEVNDETSTTSTNYVDKATLTTDPVKGVFELKWCAEIGAKDKVNLAMKVINTTDSETYQETYFEVSSEIGGTPEGYYAIGGHKIVIFTSLSSKTFKIQWKRIGLEVASVYIRNARIILQKIG